jgi:hypothetical protein
MEVSLTSIFVDKFIALSGSFYEKKSMIERGEIERAISQKPSGVWYSNDYARALMALGDTPVVINLRGDVIAASALYTSMKTNDFFYTFMASNQFWKVPPCESSFLSKKFNVLEMKRGVSPSDAYEKLASGLSFIDCASIIDVALGLAIIEKYGKSRFDEVMSFYNFRKVGNIHDRLLARCYATEEVERPSLPGLKFSTPMPVGSVYFVSNHQDYTLKHPHGTSKGMNLVCVGSDEEGQPLFTGLGLNPRGVSLNEVATILISDFNEKPIEESVLLTKEGIESFHAAEEIINFQLGDTNYSVTFDKVKKMVAGNIKSPFEPSILRGLEEEINKRELRKAILSDAKIDLPDLLSSEEDGFLSGSNFRRLIREEYIDTIFKV